ncbi:AMP-binding enzyme [Actinomadura hallensis]|uniref:AMP-binding enzyme n=1 Tax=Actinomadura hallensis TaxID=337895 RepID=A0A543IMY2_9ACTN|nr:AMP-binding protein [Actinomadura hallensis]TQM71943.1 AMP-binding enzyme [Actinomadura hallensis]HLV71954.1 AMP-binding protein [Vulgatibacteraceae bacterium]
MSALVSGGSVALLPAFSPDAALRAIERHRVTFCGAVPTMYVLMLGHESFAERDLSSVRLCVAGGSNVEPALAESIRRGFPGAPIYNLYGLSESSGACVLSRPDDDLETVSRTLGVVIGDFEARVTGPDGEVLPPGETGELQIRGDCVADGYRLVRSAPAFRPGVKRTLPRSGAGKAGSPSGDPASARLRPGGSAARCTGAGR